MPKLLATTGLAVTVAVLAAACSQQPATKSAAAPAAPAATARSGDGAAPSATAAPAATATKAKTKTKPAKPSALLTDGRHPGFIKEIGGDTVSMDLVELVTGDAAVAELKKQNPGSDPEYSDNQYAVVNDNKKVRKLPLAPSVVVKVLDDTSIEPQQTIEISAVAEHFDGRLDRTLFWFIVKQGAVTRIEELYPT